eukprot:9471388-Alexandrium_andersonii.AAC.1
MAAGHAASPPRAVDTGGVGRAGNHPRDGDPRLLPRGQGQPAHPPVRVLLPGLHDGGREHRCGDLRQAHPPGQDREAPRAVRQDQDRPHAPHHAALLPHRQGGGGA